MKTLNKFLATSIVVLLGSLWSKPATAEEIAQVCWLTDKQTLLRFSVTQTAPTHFIYTSIFAPQSGEETRRMIASRAREGADYLSTKTRDVTEKTSGVIDRGKEALQQQREQLTAAFEAGKQAYKDEKEKARG